MEIDQKQSYKLDYTLTSSKDRTELVQKIIDSLPSEKLTPHFLQILADYIIFAKTKEERKKKAAITTQNRMVTINKRQISYQGLTTKFENGEDGVYNMIIQSDKNIIFTPKISITQQNIAEIPALQELFQAIKTVEQEYKTACGRRKYLLKKQIIQMRQDQYVIKNSYYKPINCLNAVKNFNTINFDEKISVKDGKIEDQSLVSFFNAKHISVLLQNYTKLKQDSYGKFYTDGYYLIQDLENLIDSVLKEQYPFYYSILIYKIDGKTNVEIQQLLKQQHNITHSIEYISALWRNKIPKLIAEEAQKKYLLWYYSTQEYGKWKKCSRCGEIKLAHNKFFSKNNSSKDGFYSICKKCRNKKTKENKTSSTPLIIKKISYKKKEDNNG